MKISIIPLILTCLFSTATAQEMLKKIAFGSCSAHFGKQRIWNSVMDKDPDLWIWLGDNIYADTDDMDKMAARYAQLAANPNYQRLKEAMPMIATWDDHDYGGNDLGKYYPKKEESKKLFLEFFEEPKDSPRWNRQGIYASYCYGKGATKVKVILLDTRFNRDDPGPEADMLGEEQWEWLEKELRDNDAVITIIGSSVQFVNEQKLFENWAKFPASQQRMLELIGSTGVKGLFFISGDVHLGEISKREYPQVSYPIYDFTSSGLTHGNQLSGFRNPDRVPRTRWGNRNFATIEFKWHKRQVILRLHDAFGTRLYRHVIPFSELGAE